MDILGLDEHMNLQIKPYALKIKEFHDLYVFDQSKSKSMFITQITFVWYFADFASPYVKQGLSDDDKWKQIRMDIGWNTTVRNKKMINLAIKKYRELNSTETMRLLEAAQEAINSLIKYYKDLDMGEKTEKGMLVNNISQVMTSLKGIGGLNKDIKKLKTEVMAEMHQVGRVKGGEEKALFEDPE